ncbi:exonuclease domain-containing protein [Sulfurimonas sp.]|uniref:exonuclease domain-containing protein n=1 Tax=Sulfurimonas sp. TaxID=2022749 RepID=UPI002A37150C|nr:exonuclease domain-containing protein [Sulfurimonas sp.]
MLIFLDLETTGLQCSDKICSIGIIAVDKEESLSIYELVNEGKKIPAEASSINHITNEMIKGRPSLKESSAWKFLSEHNHESSTLIAHNIDFDLGMLESSGFVWQGKTIDTLRVTKHLMPECEQFSLQFLRYELKLYRDELQEAFKYGLDGGGVAHNALGDALCVKLLYESLLQIKEHDTLVELTQKNVLMQKFDFGKYSGRYIEEISMCDRGYLEWMLSNISDLDEDMRYTLKRYLHG